MVDYAPRFQSKYDDVHRSRQMIAQGKHRELIGGKWDEIGQLQLDFLQSKGLQPHHRVLDVGCGCLRAGVKIIPYLDPGNYFGIDGEKQLLEVGFHEELCLAGIQERMPRENLFHSKLFKHGRLTPESIDYGISVSVMTHRPFNFLRIALWNLATFFKPGGALYLTFFEIPEGANYAESLPSKCGDWATTGHADPYHYYRSDMEYGAHGTRWQAEYIGDWDHPRGQMMMVYTRS